MKKDINFIKVTDVAVAVVPDGLDDAGNQLYQAHLINLKEAPLENVLIRTKGFGIVNGEEVETSTVRYLMEYIGAKQSVVIEPINSELLALSNEYWVSFKHESYLYDRKYTFVPGSVLEDNFTDIPSLDVKGVLIR